MTRTIFYSWQSDRANSTNRGFIESALKKAIEVLKIDEKLLAAARDEEIKIDRDTLGVPGSPPIVDTILEKIASCDAFVADMTYIGKTNEDRYLPNPNVLIEYGFALKALGNPRVIKVMNTHYGDPFEFPLPFDMRHLRAPLRYTLAEGATAEIRAKVMLSLTKDFVIALKSVLDATAIQKSAEPFIPMKTSSVPYSFVEPGTPLLTATDFFTKKPTYEVTHIAASAMYLRLYPVTPVTPLLGADIYAAARSGHPGLLGPGQFSDMEINEHGVAFYLVGSERTSAIAFLQIFESGEIWSTNLYALSHKEVPNFEGTFADAMQSYAWLIRTIFGYDGDLHWIAGMYGIKGFPITLPPAPPGKIRLQSELGGATKNQIEANGIKKQGERPSDSLLPFYKQVWSVCGVQREAIFPR